MSGNLPFGFTPPGDGDDSGGGSGGSGVPGPMGFGPGGFDMSQLGEALQQLGRMMASGGGDAGPVNWDLARDGARQHVAQEGDPSVNATERREVEAALDLASLWLDPATSFPATSSGGGAWSRSEWIEATLPQWKRIVEPVAVRANESMAGFMPTGGGLPEGLPPELAQMAGPIMGMAKQMGAMMFGTQLGQALGTLSGEVLGAADVGIPLTDDGRSFLLPRNVAAFGRPRRDRRGTLAQLPAAAGVRPPEPAPVPRRSSRHGSDGDRAARGAQARDHARRRQRRAPRSVAVRRR